MELNAVQQRTQIKYFMYEQNYNIKGTTVLFGKQKVTWLKH